MRFLFLALLAFSSQALAQTKTYSSYSPSTVSGTSGRQYTLGLGGGLSFLTTNSVQTTSLSLDSTFGWNRDIWEAGPKVRLTYNSTAGANTTFFAVGGYGDYNFKQSSDYSMGATAAVLFGNNVNTQYSLVELGGVFKWFALKAASTAIRFEALYQTQNTTTATTGFVLRYGLQTYF